MNLREQRAAALKAAHDIINGAAGRDLTDDEQSTFDTSVSEVKSLDERLAKAAQSAEQMAALGALAPDESAPSSKSAGEPHSLGEHFMKHAGGRMKDVRGIRGASVSAPEYKAASTTHVVGSVFTPVLTEYDRTIITAVRPRLTIANLLGSGTISGNAISYLVEGALEGAFTTVAEGGAKPQLHIVDPTVVTDSLKKIAGFIKITDEMTEDEAFFVSEINNRLLYELAKFEEAQLLNGGGTGSDVLGILQRSGIQTETGATILDNADAVFRSMTKVSTGSGLDADGIVIHPTDYQAFRLKKDANLQYYGGGFFQGEYGVGGVPAQPPLWGLQTVVTPAITAGTVLVGAFAQGATVYRKGGVRVESTNSHASDFTSNLVTVRAEERIALAVRHPAGFVKLTLGTS